MLDFISFTLQVHSLHKVAEQVDKELTSTSKLIMGWVKEATADFISA